VKKVWLVSKTFWEDTEILGCFDSIEKAEKVVEDYEAVMRKWKSKAFFSIDELEVE